MEPFDDPVGRLTSAEKGLLLSLGGDGPFLGEEMEDEKEEPFVEERFEAQHAAPVMATSSVLEGPILNEGKPVNPSCVYIFS